MFKKNCFVIMHSPPPTDECRNRIRPTGELTVGCYDDVPQAWKIVLGVVGIGEDGLPVPPPPPPPPSVLWLKRTRWLKTSLKVAAYAKEDETLIQTGPLQLRQVVATADERPFRLSEPHRQEGQGDGVGG